MTKAEAVAIRESAIKARRALMGTEKGQTGVLTMDVKEVFLDGNRDPKLWFDFEKTMEYAFVEIDRIIAACDAELSPSHESREARKHNRRVASVDGGRVGETEE